MTFYQAQQKRKAYYIPLFCNGQITAKECATRLHISKVSVYYLKNLYLKKGDKAFVNGHKGLNYQNKVYSNSLRKWLADTYLKDWKDSPFRTYHKALQIYYHKTVGYDSLRYILKEAGIKPPRSWSYAEKQKHKPRKERPCAGELVQMDASTHDWFMNDTYVTLHGGIDDATHTVTGLYFCRNECRLGYNEVLRQTWTHYGIPQDYYIDRHSSFVRNKRKKSFTLTERLEHSKNEKTHFNDLCKELNIGVILALSPQAKGRIERLWQTLQGKLPYIFRFLKINTLEQANAFISSWVISFNAKFARVPISSDSKWRRLPSGFNLDYKLSVKFSCRTDCKGNFVFHNCDFELLAPLRACKNFELCLSEQYGIRAFLNNKWYEVKLKEKILQTCVCDTMPQVEQDLIARYLLNDIHADYA